MIRVLLIALLAWFLYKFIFGFVIPVYRTTRQMKKKFREMHDRMQEQQPQEQQGFQYQKKSNEPKAPTGDYIDFEEIK